MIFYIVKCHCILFLSQMSENTDLEFFETSARTGEGVSEVRMFFLIDDLHFDLWKKFTRIRFAMFLQAFMAVARQIKKFQAGKVSSCNRWSYSLNFQNRSEP